MIRRGSILFLVFRLLLAAVFAVSGVLKLQDPARFLDDVQTFQLLPYWMAYWGVLMLPWLEILCALALLTRRISSAAAMVLTGMTAFFIGMLEYARGNGIDVSCGCFGDWYVFPSYSAHIAFNLTLIVLLIAVFFRGLGPLRED